MNYKYILLFRFLQHFTESFFYFFYFIFFLTSTLSYILNFKLVGLSAEHTHADRLTLTHTLTD